MERREREGEKEGRRERKREGGIRQEEWREGGREEGGRGNMEGGRIV